MVRRTDGRTDKISYRVATRDENFFPHLKSSSLSPRFKIQPLTKGLWRARRHLTLPYLVRRKKMHYHIWKSLPYLENIIDSYSFSDFPRWKFARVRKKKKFFFVISRLWIALREERVEAGVKVKLLMRLGKERVYSEGIFCCWEHGGSYWHVRKREEGCVMKNGAAWESECVTGK